eukprot:1332318-Lingulodinium_polyedra.AAC.1
MGTELGLRDFMYENSIQSCLPNFLQYSDMDADVHGDAPVHVDGGRQPKKLMPRALVVPGMLHIMHNLTGDIEKHLAHWDKQHEDLKHI